MPHFPWTASAATVTLIYKSFSSENTLSGISGCRLKYSTVEKSWTIPTFFLIWARLSGHFQGNVFLCLSDCLWISYKWLSYQQAVTIFFYCFYQIPRIISLTPSRGPVSGGTVVNITGSHFDAGSNVSVMFKDQPCTYQRLVGTSQRWPRQSHFNSQLNGQVKLLFHTTGTKPFWHHNNILLLHIKWNITMPKEELCYIMINQGFEYTHCWKRKFCSWTPHKC